MIQKTWRQYPVNVTCVCKSNDSMQQQSCNVCIKVSVTSFVNNSGIKYLTPPQLLPLESPPPRRAVPCVSKQCYHSDGIDFPHLTRRQLLLLHICIPQRRSNIRTIIMTVIRRLKPVVIEIPLGA